MRRSWSRCRYIITPVNGFSFRTPSRITSPHPSTTAGDDDTTSSRRSFILSATLSPTLSSSGSARSSSSPPHQPCLLFAYPYRIHIIRRIASHPVTIFWISFLYPTSHVYHLHTRSTSMQACFHPHLLFCVSTPHQSVYPALHFFLLFFYSLMTAMAMTNTFFYYYFYDIPFFFLLLFFMLFYLILSIRCWFLLRRLFHSSPFLFSGVCLCHNIFLKSDQPTHQHTNNNKCIKYRTLWFCRLECFISFS